MNSDNPIQILQAGFRLSLGATASIIESLQDQQKRDETVSKLMNAEFALLTKEWAEKGEVAEQEARSYLDSLLNQPRGEAPSETPGTPGATTATPNPVAAPDVQLELQELTAQIAAMRAELEKLRTQGSPP